MDDSGAGLRAEIDGVMNTALGSILRASSLFSATRQARERT
jgi:hypothetical protein